MSSTNGQCVISTWCIERLISRLNTHAVFCSLMHSKSQQNDICVCLHNFFYVLVYLSMCRSSSSSINRRCCNCFSSSTTSSCLVETCNTHITTLSHTYTHIYIFLFVFYHAHA